MLAHFASRWSAESAAIAARRPDERPPRKRKPRTGTGPDEAPAATPAEEDAAPVPASLKRRLAALAYDALLVLGIWMLLVFGFVMGNNDRVVPTHAFALLLGSAVLFCSYFWVAHGRTLGMQAWHLRLQSKDGGRVTLTQALARFTVLFPGVLLLQVAEFVRPAVIFALLYFQAAYLWALFNPARATWADLVSQTRMVRIPPPKR